MIANQEDVLGAISVYIEKNNRPCPAHHLMTKFGEDVVEVLYDLKRAKKIIGKRGRNGGLVLPDTVFVSKITVPQIDSVMQNANAIADKEEQADRTSDDVYNEMAMDHLS